MTQLIDLTRPLAPVDPTKFPELLKPLLRIIAPEIEYVDNQAGAEIMMSFFGCGKDDLPDGEGWAEENISLSSHLGTHVDAPLHYGSKCGDSKAKTIDQISLDDLYLDTVVLDLSHKRGTGGAITVDDLKQALDRIEYKIKERDAVLIRTDHDKYEITDPLKYNYPGLVGESALWLSEQGALVGGTDALGWDRPFMVMMMDYKRTGDKSKIWDAHFAHRDKEFYVVQQLVDLDKLPAFGFKTAFFPINLVGASAAPARVVAFLENMEK
ncbi:MAG TPA: cyclase family protein [Candidatus Melainabacteria bacterium]|nr:cyclase family protein [Candidatus Melainabacteria bacterium]HMP53424.1 cyclase family protein [Candidatus Melainabacteria bacterium]